MSGGGGAVLEIAGPGADFFRAAPNPDPGDLGQLEGRAGASGRVEEFDLEQGVGFEARNGQPVEVEDDFIRSPQAPDIDVERPHVAELSEAFHMVQLDARIDGAMPIFHVSQELVHVGRALDMMADERCAQEHEPGQSKRHGRDGCELSAADHRASGSCERSGEGGGADVSWGRAGAEGSDLRQFLALLIMPKARANRAAAAIIVTERRMARNTHAFWGGLVRIDGGWRIARHLKIGEGWMGCPNCDPGKQGSHPVAEVMFHCIIGASGVMRGGYAVACTRMVCRL